MPVKKSKPSKSRKTVAEQVDEQLARYRTMRHFDKTAEPRGGSASSPKAGRSTLPFVVQKHAATRLHYDFRLGWRGVLKSWAVTKGPSYVTADKRLAVQVEDHPMQYGGFEGVIPKGEYGGGTVMLWDEGTWEPHGNVDEDLARGKMKFTLHGSKLRGAWVLVRMGGKAAQESKPNWLLIKEHDNYERSADDPVILDEQPNSVITGRDFSQIASEQDHTWNSRPASQSRSKPVKKAAAANINTDAIAAAVKESFPDFIAPALAYAGTEPPFGENWVHELKLDGYRIQAHLQSLGKFKDAQLSVKLLTRKGLDWTHRMPGIASALAPLRVENAILDGEVIVTDSSGLSSFAALQAAFQSNKASELIYFIFDVLHLNGMNTRDLPLSERKDLTRSLVESLGADKTIQFSEHFATNGAIMFGEACKLGAEGVVSKLISSPYISGRNRSWVKSKCVLEQEFVIGGYTLPLNGTRGVGAILVGYYEGNKLTYAGKTGTGFSQDSSRLLRDRLETLQRKSPPFVEVPGYVKRKAIWVDPDLVAQINFRTWTADGLIRQSAFKGLREDKPPSEVVRERSILPATIEEDSLTTSSSQKSASTAAPRRPISSKGRLTHPDKIIDPESGLTKQQLAAYYEEIAPYLLPHIAGRPLSIIRCPGGSGEKCFFQRHLNSSSPRGLEGIEIRNKDGDEKEIYLTLITAEALIGMAQMNVLELHPWGCTNRDIEHPDRLVFDLDPDVSISWSTLAGSALDIRSRLKQIGLKSFVKVTGGKGLHVMAPIQPVLSWAELKSVAHAFVLQMEKDEPRLYLTKMTKSARKGKIYLDYLRNERGATAVAPFSPRARAGMPASLPLAWDELKQGSVPQFRLADISQWRARLKQDPWKGMLTLIQKIKIE